MNMRRRKAQVKKKERAPLAGDQYYDKKVENFQRKRDIVDSFRNGSQRRLEKTANLDLIFGEASFTGPKSVSVRMRDGARRALSVDRIFINAGARPSVPKLEGLKDVPFLDSTSIMELDSVPEHLLVVGGGYVGLEFGQLFQRLGSRVTIVQSAAQLLVREDADVAEEVRAILKQDGIEVLLNAKTERIAKSGGQIQLTARVDNEPRTLQGERAGLSRRMADDRGAEAGRAGARPQPLH